MIDLHTHSTASDGTLSPLQLIDFAISEGVTHLAMTDHDTVDGIEEAVNYAKGKDIKFAYGVEVSAEFNGKTMHIIGYGIRFKDKSLNQRLKVLKEAREERNPKIVEKLNNLGFNISYKEVEEEAGSSIIGRPHFAKVMVKKGYVSSIQEAFDKYLARGTICYVEKFRFTPEEAIKLIIESGGFSVLAHPLSLKLDYDEVKNVALQLKSYGLKGMECFYRNHTKKDEEELLKIAKELNLLVSGGSDFHGANRPLIKIGRGEGEMDIPLWVGEKFFEEYMRYCSL